MKTVKSTNHGLVVDDKQATTPIVQPRPVFGVPLEESVAVSQIANLPSVVFRCIQYLEAKKADREEGIYRATVSPSILEILTERFNDGKN